MVVDQIWFGVMQGVRLMHANLALALTFAPRDFALEMDLTGG